MSHVLPAKRGATYQDVLDAPEHMVAELLGGNLYLSPRPAPAHARVYTNLGGLLVPPLQFGRGGPGGWVIRDEPELHLTVSGDKRVLVPDTAAWRAKRYEEPDTAFYSVVPDWICEIASPSTAKLDREEKLPTYREVGVTFAWIIDPVLQTIDVYNGNANQWTLVGSFVGNGIVRIKPFEDIELDLSLLWT